MATEAEQSTLVPKVAERLRFFFSDANLRCDKFLQNEVFENEFVPVTTLLKFNTIKKLSEDPAILVKAVKDDEQVKTRLKLNEDESSIARVTPFTKDMVDDRAKVTLRVSNIPVTGEQGEEVYGVKREDVEGLFKEYGQVAMVNMLHAFRREGGGSKRIAIGRAFVEFETAAEMEKAAADLCVEATAKEGEDAAKPKKTLKMGDNEIRVKTYQQWVEKKKKDNATRNERRGKNQSPKRPRENDAPSEPVETFKLDWKKGCVISLKGLPEGCDREKILETIKEVVGNSDGVRADYSRGQKDGAIRFDEPSDKIAELSKKLSEGTAQIGGSKVESASIMEGEEEEKYYANFIAFRTRQMQMKKDEKNQRKKHRRN